MSRILEVPTLALDNLEAATAKTRGLLFLLAAAAIRDPDDLAVSPMTNEDREGIAWLAMDSGENLRTAVDVVSGAGTATEKNAPESISRGGALEVAQSPGSPNAAKMQWHSGVLQSHPVAREGMKGANSVDSTKNALESPLAECPFCATHHLQVISWNSERPDGLGYFYGDSVRCLNCEAIAPLKVWTRRNNNGNGGDR